MTNKVASYYLSLETINAINMLAEREARKKSTIIERAIKLYMERESE